LKISISAHLLLAFAFRAGTFFFVAMLISTSFF
jgi:hypothetical protein